MADVTFQGRRANAATGRAERGQLILVTALGLAILFVSLALILNTAIYTENLATRSSDIGGGTDAVRYHDTARSGVAGLLDYANTHNNTSHVALTTNLTTGVTAFDNDSARQFSTSTRAAETELDAQQNGTRIAQSDASRNFSNASGNANWPVASGVTNTRAIRFEVSTPLTNITSDAFRLSVTDGTDHWNMTVRENLGDIEVRVEGPTVSDTCAVAASSAWINLSAETLGGTDCEALGTFADGVSTPYDIEFEHGDQINGTYTMIVDDPSLAGSPSPHLNNSGGGQPFATHAIYSANLTVRYETPRLYYETTVRVAPDEPT